MLLLVDRWEGLVQAYQDVDLGRRIDELLRLLREGPAVGLRAVVTADRSGLLGRLPSVMPDKLVLRLADRADYALADIPAREVPVSAPPGRGLVLGAGPARTLQEVQIALLTGGPAGPAQLAALQRLDRSSQGPERPASRRCTSRSGSTRCRPGSPVDRALSLGPTAGRGRRTVGARSASAVTTFGRSGSTSPRTARASWSLGRPGPDAAPRWLRWPSRCCAPRRTVCLVVTRAFAAALAVVASRSHRLPRRACRRGEASGRAERSPAQPPVVVVDDAERLTDTAIGFALERLLEAGSGSCVLAAGNSAELQSTYRGFTLDLRRSRCGLLLNPQSSPRR